MRWSQRSYRVSIQRFDVAAWKTTLDRLRGLGVRTLYRTHFGATSDVDGELDRFEETLDVSVGWIRDMLDRGLEREQMIEEFSRLMRSRAVELGLDDRQTRAYELANPRVMSVDGIVRYLLKDNR